MILNELKNLLLREEDEYNYYNFGFEVDLDKLNISEDEYFKFKDEVDGNISGYYGDLEDVESVIYEDILSVTGQLKLPLETTYATYNKSVAELSLDIYNEKLMEVFNTLITDIDVKFLDDTEKFE